MRSDDLAPLFAGRGDDQVVGFRQATVTAWDAIAGTNQLLIGGRLHDNVSILNGAEAYSITPGDVVGVLATRSQFFVLGRITVPGQGKPIAGFDSDAASATNSVVFNSNSSGFVAVSGGPTVDNVEVFTGRLLVIVTAHMLVQDIARCYFGYELAGAGQVAAARERSAFTRGRVSTSTERNPAFAHMHTGLAAGTYTIEARAEAADVQAIVGVNDVELGARTIIAIPY